MSVIEVNSLEELNDLTSTEQTVVVDVSALDWCVNCKRLHPTFEKASEESDATFVLVDLDTNDWAEVALGIQGLPTLIRYDGGVETKRASGMAAVALIREA